MCSAAPLAPPRPRGGARGGAEKLTQVDINGLSVKVWEKWREEEHVWPAAKILADYLISPATRPPYCGSADLIVEAGAGTGLLSLILGAAAEESAAQSQSAPAWPPVVATDCDRAALRNMKRNVQENGLGRRVSIQEWNWLFPTLPPWSAEVDLLVASDIIYDNTTAYLHLSRHLAEILSRHHRNTQGAASQEQEVSTQGGTSHHGPIALMLLQVRNGGQGYTGSSVEAFMSDLRARKLQVECLKLPPSCTRAYQEDFPDLHERLHLLQISAPAHTPVDFKSSPGAYGRLDRTCLGDGMCDEEILAMWQQSDL